MLEHKQKTNKNLYLEIDGERQWCRKLDFAIRIGRKAKKAGLDVKLIETVRLWDVEPGRSPEEIDYNEYDRSHLLEYEAV